MILGFTGTSRGMAPRQLKVMRQLLYNINTLHLGDCIGADTEAYDAALQFGIKLIGHPPCNGCKRAFLSYDEERAEKSYLDCNHDIVAEGIDGLIATPHGFVEEQRSGTWATIRYARQLKRRIWIVLPDGTKRSI
jgi:hypothetical protein